MVKKQPKTRLWRKAKIEDVEEALEDERLIHRMKTKGKKTGEDDDADDLFTVDTKGSFEGLSRSSRREIARAKIFPPKGPNIGMTSSEEGKIVRAERQLEASRRPSKPKAAEVYDLWAEPAVKTPSASDRSSIDCNGRSSGGLKRQRDRKPLNVKVPGTLHQKVGLAPAVIPAHEGQSINPHREAYEDLACMAAATELERERENEELDRKMKPITHELRDLVGEEKLRGMDDAEKMRLYQTLRSKAAAADDGEEGEATSSKRDKRWKQKSQSLRNKKAYRRGVDEIQDQAQAQKRLAKQVGEVGSLLKGMQDEDEFHKNRKKYRESLRAKRKELEITAGVVPKKRKIGGGKYAEEAAIVPDANAGAKGLRAMPLRTSAVKDRLASVVRRGMLPPPSEASKEKSNFLKKRNNKLKRGRKFISPLLKDNLLLR